MDNIIQEAAEDNAYRSRVAIFQKVLIAACILGLVAVISYIWWSSSKAKSEKESVEISELLLDYNKQKTAAPEDEIAQLDKKVAKSSAKFSSFAKLHLAGLNLRQKNYAKAAEVFRSVADSKDSSEVLRHYAKIMLVSIAIDHSKILPKEEIENCIKDLDAPVTPFTDNAKIVKSLYLVKENKFDEARRILSTVLKSPTISDTIKFEAAAILEAF